MGHWYDKEGNPHYSAGMREARENGYLPSVTTVDKDVIANEGITQYRINQVLEAAFTEPNRYDKYTDWKREVNRQARQHSRKAAQFGTIIHYMLSYYIRHGRVMYYGPKSHIKNVFETARAWVVEHLIINAGFNQCEHVLVTDLYAGKADYAGICDKRETLIDWKTQDVRHPGYFKKDPTRKKADPVNFYDSWTRQLAALQVAFCHQYPHLRQHRCLSVVIGTNPANLGVWVREWTQDELDDAWQDFDAALGIYYRRHRLPFDRRAVA